MLKLKEKISIGTVQFAVCDAENIHALREHPLGSISRLIPELLSNFLGYLGFDSVVTKLVATNPEDEQKQLIYTSMLPVETVRKILDTRYFDYFLYGEISFEDGLKVEISLLENGSNDNHWRRVLTFKNNNMAVIAKRIIEEVVKLIKTDINIRKINFTDDLYTDNLKAWGWYALSYEEDLTAKEIEEALMKVIEIDQNFLAGKLRLIALWLSDKEKSAEAISGLKKIEDKLSPQILNYYGEELFNQEKYPQASFFFETSLKKDNSQQGIFYRLIKINYELNDINKLKKYLNKYISLTPENEIDYENIPFYVYFLGDKERALELAYKGIAINPSAKLYSVLGFINMSTKNYSEATDAFEKSFNLSFNSSILEDWSAALLNLRDFNTVIDIIEKYKEDLGYNSGLDCNLAIAYLNLNNNEKAIDILEKSVGKDAANSKALALLANIYVKMKRYAEAKDYLEKAISLEPKNPFWNKAIGDIYYDLGDIEKAISSYKKATNLMPELKIARYLCYKAKILRESNNHKEAIEKCMVAAKVEPELWHPFNLIALILIDLKDEERAVVFFEKAIQKDPENPEIWFNLYRYYLGKSKGFFKKKWKVKAEETYKKYKECSEKNGKETEVAR